MLRPLAGKRTIMLENLAGYHLVLASNSPRRSELMNGLGLSYTVQALQGVDESYPSYLKGAEIALHIATVKANTFRGQMRVSDLVITADTIVCCGNEVFGKPADKTDAVRMLRALSGKSHFVYTGVCLTSMTHRVAFTAETEVSFSPLSEEEIDHYVTFYKPMDKAGAYGVQEWIGFVGVERISGSYFNVMGLPVHRLYLELKKFPALVL
jgi:septum formation protein